MMNGTAQQSSTVRGLYPQREEMRTIPRPSHMQPSLVRRAPTEEELGRIVSFDALSEQGKSHLAAIMAYENEGGVIRCAEDQEFSIEAARQIFHGLKQYLAVCVFSGGKRTPAKIVDECWHTFLLHSRDYAEFCEQYTRGFVHHEPAIDDSGFSFYPRTRQCVIALFGHIDEDVWPSEHKVYVRCVSTKTSEPSRFDDFLIK
mgnify:FL=1